MGLRWTFPKIPLAVQPRRDSLSSMKYFMHHKTESGRSPSMEYLEKLKGGIERDKLDWLIGHLSKEERPSGTQFRCLKGFQNLWEIKCGIHRLVVFHLKGEQWIIIHAFRKPNPNKQQEEIGVAEKRKRAYYPEAK